MELSAIYANDRKVLEKVIGLLIGSLKSFHFDNNYKFLICVFQMFATISTVKRISLNGNSAWI